LGELRKIESEAADALRKRGLDPEESVREISKKLPTKVGA
jgi:hypothetical protein